MQKLVRDYLNELNKKQKRRRKAGIAALLLVVLVVGTVIGTLTQYGVAWTGEPECGVEEHQHNEKCYGEVPICGQEESEEHQHTDSCYQLVCGMQEHQHNENCYTAADVGTYADAGAGVGTDANTDTDADISTDVNIDTDVNTDTAPDPNVDVENIGIWDAQYAEMERQSVWAADLVTAAGVQLAFGYKESEKNYEEAEDGSRKGYTRYGQFVGDQYRDWNTAFVNFCMYYAGLMESHLFPDEKDGIRSERFPEGLTDSAKWQEEFRKINEQNEKALACLSEAADYEPKAGDLVFFEKDKEDGSGAKENRMGVVSSYNKENGELKVIEGDSDNAVKENIYSTGDANSGIVRYLDITALENGFESNWTEPADQTGSDKNDSQKEGEEGTPAQNGSEREDNKAPAQNGSKGGTEGTPVQNDSEGEVKEEPAQDDIAPESASLDAEDGTLQKRITASESSEVNIKLDKNYTENLVIPDGKTVTIDLNGYTITAVREDAGEESEEAQENTTMNMITVYGNLILEDSQEAGCISGGGLDDIRAVTVASRGSFTMKSGLIEGFHVNGNGAGVRVEDNGSFIMEGGKIQNNTAAEGYGGAVFAYSSEGITLTSGRISNNSAQYGGGLAVNLIAEEGLSLPEGMVFSDNKASGYGGGIYLANAGTFTLRGVEIRENSAPSGGGIWFEGATDAQLNDCTIKDNQATEGNGGGIGSGAAVTLTIGGGVLTGNTAANYGGAVCLEVCNSALHITDECQITKNQAKTYGGGIALVNQGGDATKRSTLTVESSRIEENALLGTANSLFGGGIMAGNYTDVKINNAKILKNSGATNGGGLYIGEHANAELTEVTVNKNTIHTVSSRSYGGGIYKGNNGTMLLEDCTVTQNGESTVLEDTGDPSVDDSDTDDIDIDENENDDNAYGEDRGIMGGGIYINSTGGTTTIAGNTLISRNKAGYGGGIGGGKITVQDTKETSLSDASAGVRIEHNYSRLEGGGIYASTVTLKGHTKVRRNTASASGGGISGSTVYLQDETDIVKNKAGGEGGGIYGTVTMEGGYIRRNYAAGSGGGIRTSNLKMSGGEIHNNRAKGHGGGIYYWYNNTIEITGGKIFNNNANSYGGGIYVADYFSGNKLYEHHFTDVEIRGNHANYGGGIYQGIWNDLKLTNVTLTENTANQNGGGLYRAAGYGEVHFTGCAVHSNQAKVKGRDVFANGTHAIDQNSQYAKCHYARVDLPKASEMSGAGSDSIWMDENTGGMIDDPGEKNKEEIKNAETPNYVDGTWTDCTTKNISDMALTFVAYEEGVAEVNGETYRSIQSAVDSLKNVEAADEVPVIRLQQDSRENVTIPEGIQVKLDLNGKTLRGLTSSVIRVEPNAKLTIQDSSESKEGSIQDGRGTLSRCNSNQEKLYGGGLFVEGTVVLESGTITNNKANYGSAVYICNGGAFEMSGGKITGNRDGEGAVSVYRNEQNEKGDKGKAVFRMSGGEISDNGVRGVIVSGGSEFEMSGGEIRDHKGTGSGAGVYLGRYAHFTMTGGEITRNTTSSTTGGAGIFAVEFARLDLSGGEIIGNQNTALEARGAGIYYSTNQATAYLMLKGTKMQGNTSGAHAQDIYLCPNANVKYLQAASEMTGNPTDCWYDDINKEEITESLKDSRENKEKSLSVAKIGMEHTPAARVGEEEYDSIRKAVEAAKEAAKSGEEDTTVYLLRDVTESVKLTDNAQEKTQIVIDLNGYTLSPEGGYIFNLLGVDLKLTNSTPDKGGMIASEDAKGSRAVYVNNTTKLSTSPANYVKLTLKDLTIRGFQGALEGGAVYVNGSADIKISNCIIADCSAAGNGGALFLRPNNAGWTDSPYSLMIKGGKITGNTAGASGGGIYVGGGYSENTVVIDGTQFENNKSTTYGGGFAFNGNNNTNEATDITIQGTEFKGNNAGSNGAGANIGWAKKAFLSGVEFTENRAVSNGGGLRLYNNKDYGQDASITDCTFTENMAVKGSGGGLYLYEGCLLQVEIADCMMSENTALAGSGGGIYSYNTKLTMSKCRVIGNRSLNAGGIYVHSNKEAVRSVISDSEIRGNQVPASADTCGGGLYVYYYVNVINTTIMQNKAYNGGGVFLNQYKGILKNVNIKENQAYGNGGAVYMSGSWGGSNNPSASNYYTASLQGCKIVQNKCPASAVYIGTGTNNVEISGSGEENSEDGWIPTEISGNTGRGIQIEGRDTMYSSLKLKNGTKISDNETTGSGAGIYASYTDMTMEDGVSIEKNVAKDSGGGLYMQMSRLDMAGGTFRENEAKYGGAIRIYGNRIVNKELYTTQLNISGGTITGNTAAENGGAIYENAQDTTAYGKDPWVEVNLTGGTITGNTAGKQGGGIYTHYNNNLISLTKGARLYSNKASLGQDVYMYYRSQNSRSNRLELIKASDMFWEEGSALQGVAWLDEARNTSIEGEIKTNPSRYYALSLLSETRDVVAYAGTYPFTSVQAAVNYAAENPEACVLKEDRETENPKPTVTLAKDVRESVMVPSEFDGIVNLNGYTLRGHTTAIDCYGTLRIRDMEYVQDSLKELVTHKGAFETGTITGSAPEYGGGIRVRSGGYAVLESGQISGCQAAVNYNSAEYGGAAVCADAGTFELTGTGKITGNTSFRGAAVFVRSGSSRFLMTGGSITENNSTEAGAIYNNGGTVQITGGAVTDNTSKYGGAVYNRSGTLRIAGGTSPVTITGNQASVKGGGIYQENGTITLANVNLINNKVTAVRHQTDVTTGAGGAVFQNNGTLTISDGVRFERNSAVRGGAIYQSNGTVRMLGGSITKNSAQMGGGVAQYPLNIGKFTLVYGCVYDNRSTLSSAGNDFYSRYEGTGEYGPENGDKVPELTLPAAVSMGNKRYNVWKDDSYEGENRTGTQITTGQYITANIVDSFNVELTADKYDVNAIVDLSSDVKISSLVIASPDGKSNGMVDGYGSWDTAAKDTEKTAKQMMEENPSDYMESDQQYPFNGTFENYIKGPDDQRYEREQIVQWSPGDDSDNQNSLVRTFDKVTYTLQMVFETEDESSDTKGDPETGNEEEDKKEDDKEEDDKIRTVHVWMEMKLPCGEDKATFVTSSLGMDAYSITPVIEDGKEVQYLKGYREWKISSKDKMKTQNLEIQITGAKNADTIKPEFTAWIEGNEENEKNPAACDSRMLTVSASRSSRYNVSVDYNNTLSYTSYFNMETGEEASKEEMQKEGSHIVYGTILGYGLTVELYNKAGKGIKGIEASSEGSVGFDLNLKGGLYLDGKQLCNKKGEPISSAPYIWAYKENVNSDFGMKLNGINYDRNMDWNDVDDVKKTTNHAYNAAPFNSGGGSNSCYSGGSWSIKEQNPEGQDKETTVHVEVSGYNFNYNDSNPAYNSDGSRNPILASDNVKAFSAGYVQVLYPLNEEDVTGQNGYLSIGMDAAVTGFHTSDQDSNADRTDESVSDEDLGALAKYYYGEATEQNIAQLRQKPGCAVNEPFYSDNCSFGSFGMYVWSGGGNGDNITKTNEFLKENRTKISGEKGNGNTPLNSTVYIDGKVSFTSKQIRTDDASDTAHYIPDDKFDTDTDNKIEYDYLTAFNVLQKFDARAYTPVGTEPVTGIPYTFGTAIGSGIPFSITSTETEAQWSSTATKTCDLTILYAAKPDGNNWDEAPGDNNHKITADMDQYREENLLYFETMGDLKTYFEQQGNDDAKCVAILYEFRNACIRKDRSVTVSSRMKVTDDFNYTGGTYCTTNDVRGWSTYRPIYKEHYGNAEKPLTDILYQFRWENVEYEGAAGSGVNVYGVALSSDNHYDGTPNSNMKGADKYFEQEKGNSFDKRMFITSYWDGYIPAQYEHGSIKPDTHNGWLSGNTLLLYTIDTSIIHTTADVMPGSNGKLKTTYDVGGGERLVNFQITPSISVSSSVTDHELVTNGSQRAEITIEVELPDKLNYTPQSIRFDYTKCGYKDGELQWEIESSEDGKLSLRTTVADISKGLPKIYYSCKIGNEDNPNEDVVHGQSLASIARIYAEYEEVHRLASESHTGNAQIQILKSSANGGWLDVKDVLVEIGDDLEYNLHFTNGVDQEVSNIEFCDVLPYVGDGRGSDFRGGYEVTGISVTFGSKNDYDAYMAEVVKNPPLLKSIKGKKVPTTNTEQKSLMDEAKSNADAKWSTFQVKDGSEGEETEYEVDYSIEKGTLRQTATDKTGIALYGMVPKISGKSGFTVTLRLSPKSSGEGTSIGTLLKDNNNNVQKGADIYQNSFYYRTGSSIANSNQHHIQAVGRTVSGKVWMDQDHDGKWNNSEASLSGIDVVLMRQGGNEWVQAQDVLGREMEAETGTDGSYMFENLPAGTYTVWFKDDDNDYQMQQGKEQSQPLGFGQLSVTMLDGNRSNCAVSHYKTKDTTDDPAALDRAELGDPLQLPERNSIQSAQFSRANQDCGLYYTDLTLTKRWANLLEPVKEGTDVTLQVDRSIGESENNKTEMNPVQYIMRQGVEKTQVTAKVVKGTTPTEENPPVVKVEEMKPENPPYVCTWTIEHIALQAEGEKGPVNYTYSEPTDIPGYKKTETPLVSDSGRVTFTAENRQILHTVSVTKVKKGNTEQTLAGASFGIYSDPECRTKLKQKDSGSSDITNITELAAGTYYLKEIKAPTGYSLNAAVFEVKIAYEDNKPTEPSVTVKQIKDEITGEPISENQPSITVTTTPTAEGNYTISFKVGDDILYSLPSTGGVGIFLYILAGIVLMMAASYLYWKKVRAQAA